MRIFLLVVSVMMATAASADTYKFVDGAPRTSGDNRCASPSSMKRLGDWVVLSKITIGHDQATLSLQDKPFGEDGQWFESGSVTYQFKITPQLTVLVRVDAFSCQHGDCKVMKASYGILQRYQDASCYEQWDGHIESLKGAPHE